MKDATKKAIKLDMFVAVIGFGLVGFDCYFGHDKIWQILVLVFGCLMLLSAVIAQAADAAEKDAQSP